MLKRWSAEGPGAPGPKLLKFGGPLMSRHKGTPALEPWCVEVSRVSDGVGQCRGSVEAVSVDTGVGVSGSVGLQCRGSVGAR